jgi:hypothetical protein
MLKLLRALFKKNTWKISDQTTCNMLSCRSVFRTPHVDYRIMLRPLRNICMYIFILWVYVREEFCKSWQHLHNMLDVTIYVSRLIQRMHQSIIKLMIAACTLDPRFKTIPSRNHFPISTFSLHVPCSKQWRRPKIQS